MDLLPNQEAVRDLSQTLPASTPLTQPYWLRQNTPRGCSASKTPP